MTLVRNEDLHVERAVRNVADFCDELILIDHRSRDGTRQILASLAANLPHATFHSIDHPSESHKLLQKFARTKTWVFAVDGDEIYDPDRLAAFRTRLIEGEFDDFWMIMGNVLHVTGLDLDLGSARGHLTPPSRSITKLYNFSAIDSWEGEAMERLHGGQPRFRPGFHANAKFLLYERYSWESSPLRCLHLCFCRRSTLDEEKPSSRKNIMESHGENLLARFLHCATKAFGGGRSSSWKSQNYGRGLEVSTSTASFFPS